MADEDEVGAATATASRAAAEIPVEKRMVLDVQGRVSDALR